MNKSSIPFSPLRQQQEIWKSPPSTSSPYNLRLPDPECGRSLSARIRRRAAPRTSSYCRHRSRLRSRSAQEMPAAFWTMGSNLQGHARNGRDYGTVQAAPKAKTAGTTGSSEGFEGKRSTTGGSADGPLRVNLGWRRTFNRVDFSKVVF